MSDDKPTIDVAAMVLELARGIFGKQGLLALALIAASVLVTLWATSALGQTVGAKVDAGVAPVVTELAEHKKSEAELHRVEAQKVEQLEQRIHSVEISALETSMNVQLLVRERGLKPVELPRPAAPVDGGTP